MIVDSSFLVSFYDNDDSNHEKAIKIMKENEHQNIFISHYVIGETATVFRNKRGLEAAKKFIDTIQNIETFVVVHPTEIDFNRILKVFENQKKKLSFVDASVVYFALILRKNTLNFDEEIETEIERLKKVGNVQ